MENLYWKKHDSKDQKAVIPRHHICMNDSFVDSFQNFDKNEELFPKVLPNLKKCVEIYWNSAQKSIEKSI